MQHADQVALLRRAQDHLAARGPVGAGEELQVPVSLYVDPARFEREHALHRRALSLVAHVTELREPGSFLTFDLLGTPVLLVRDGDTMRAFVNVCRHRGARVEREVRGCKRRFTCPYHAWSYGPDGGLRAVRHREGFPSLPDDTSLVPLATEVAGPFVWVCPDPTAAPVLDAHARRLCEEIASLQPGDLTVHQRDETRWKANWKLLVEGGIESYHFKIAHRKTVGPLFEDTSSFFDAFGDHLRSVLPRTSVRTLHEVPESDWRLVQHANVLYTLAPGAAILLQDGHYVLVLMFPEAVDATRIDLITVGRRVPEGERGARVEAFLKANHAFTVQTLEEDFVLAEEIQGGFASGANATLRFGAFEDALTLWHGRLAERLSGA